MQPNAARVLTALFLSLTLALSGVTLARAHGAAPGLHQVVICSGAGTVTLTLDADGNPAGPPLPCPDCIAGLAAALPEQPAAAPDRLQPAERLLLPAATPRTATAPHVRRARGPPVPV